MSYTDLSTTWVYKRLVEWKLMDQHAENSDDIHEYMRDRSFLAFQSFTMSGTYTVAKNTWTKVRINSETFDINSTFDSTTNYRYTPASLGKYLIGGQVPMDPVGDYQMLRCGIYKNGSLFKRGTAVSSIQTNGNSTSSISRVLALVDVSAVTDYFELWGYHAGAADDPNTGFFRDAAATTLQPIFWGYKII